MAACDKKEKIMSTEPTTAAVLLTMDLPVTEGNGGYKLSRFNAMRHGILSQHIVLAHEDGAQYQALLQALVEEHNPMGATEMHLIEEMAGCIWRKELR